MNINFTIDLLEEKMPSIGGIIFKDPYLMNISVIRDLYNPDEWNDSIIYFYYDKNGNPIITQVNEFTANPGVKYLKSPMSDLGTAIVVGGWYRKLWKLGFHKGQYEALVQNTPISVYRDSNMDEEIDLSSATISTGMYGINLHRANVNSIAEKVGPHSAGCFVFRRYDDWTNFMNKVHECRDKGNQKYWSLALFDKSEFITN